MQTNTLKDKTAVFIFPRKLGEGTLFSFNQRSNDPKIMKRSLPSRLKNTNAFSLLSSKQHKYRAISKKTLSANGSKTFPISVSAFHFLAKKPSKASVKAIKKKNRGRYFGSIYSIKGAKDSLRKDIKLGSRLIFSF